MKAECRKLLYVVSTSTILLCYLIAKFPMNVGYHHSSCLLRFLLSLLIPFKVPTKEIRYQPIFFNRYDNPILVFPVFSSFSTPRKLNPNSFGSLGPVKPESCDILSRNDSASADTGIGEYLLKSSIIGLTRSSSDHSVTHRPTARFGVTILSSSYSAVWSSSLKRESVILTSDLPWSIL